MRRLVLFLPAVVVGSCPIQAPEAASPMESIGEFEEGRIEAYAVEIEKTLDGESRNHTDEWTIQTGPGGEVLYASFASWLDVSFPSAEAARLMFPPLSAAELVEGNVIERVWTIAGSSRREAGPQLEERIDVVSCANRICEVTWERNGSYEERDTTKRLEQSGSGHYDGRYQLYLNTESRLSVTRGDETRTTQTSVVFDPTQTLVESKEYLALESAREAGAADFDAWNEAHPPGERAESEIRKRQGALDLALEQGDTSCGFGGSAVAFFAAAQPEVSWDVALNLPPGTGRGDAISAIWHAQRALDIPVSDAHIERLIQLGQEHEEARFEVAKVADPRLLEELERLVREEDDEFVRGLAAESLAVVNGAADPRANPIDTIFIPVDELGTLPDALEQLQNAPRTEVTYALRRLTQLTFHDVGPELDDWQTFAEQHGHLSRQEWALLALRGDAMGAREEAARGMAGLSPFAEGAAQLVEAAETGSFQLRFHAARALVSWGDPRGTDALIGLLSARGTGHSDSDVISRLAQSAGTDFGLLQHHEGPDRAAAVGRWQEWARRQQR